MSDTNKLLAGLRDAANRLTNCRLAVPSKDGKRSQCGRLVQMVAVVVDEVGGGQSYVCLDSIRGDYDEVREGERRDEVLERAAEWLRERHVGEPCPICGSMEGEE